MNPPVGIPPYLSERPREASTITTRPTQFLYLGGWTLEVDRAS